MPAQADEGARVRPLKAGCSCRTEEDLEEAEKSVWWKIGCSFLGLQPGLQVFLPSASELLFKEQRAECLVF